MISKKNRKLSRGPGLSSHGYCPCASSMASVSEGGSPEIGGGVITQGVVRGVRANKHESIALVEYAVPGEGMRVREVPVSRPFVHEIKTGEKTLHVKVRYLPQDYKVESPPVF